MNIEIYKQKTSNLFAENRVLKLCLLLITSFSILNLYANFHLVQDRKTIIMPVGYGGPFEVSERSVESGYIRMISRYITSMIGNYTASTVENQLDELLQLMSPKTYVIAQDQFERLKKEVKNYSSISYQMVWVGEEPLKATDERIEIDVIRHRLVNGDITRSDKKLITIDYHIEDGRFWIDAINEKENEV